MTIPTRRWLRGFVVITTLSAALYLAFVGLQSYPPQAACSRGSVDQDCKIITLEIRPSPGSDLEDRLLRVLSGLSAQSTFHARIWGRRWDTGKIVEVYDEAIDEAGPALPYRDGLFAGLEDLTSGVEVWRGSDEESRQQSAVFVQATTRRLAGLAPELLGAPHRCRSLEFLVLPVAELERRTPLAWANLEQLASPLCPLDSRVIILPPGTPQSAPRTGRAPVFEESLARYFQARRVRTHDLFLDVSGSVLGTGEAVDRDSVYSIYGEKLVVPLQRHGLFFAGDEVRFWAAGAEVTLLDRSTLSGVATFNRDSAIPDTTKTSLESVFVKLRRLQQEPPAMGRLFAAFSERVRLQQARPVVGWLFIFLEELGRRQAPHGGLGPISAWLFTDGVDDPPGGKEADTLSEFVAGCVPVSADGGWLHLLLVEPTAGSWHGDWESLRKSRDDIRRAAECLGLEVVEHAPTPVAPELPQCRGHAIAAP